MSKRKVSANNFVATIAANVNNERITDAVFRAFIRNTLSIVQYEIQVGQPLEKDYVKKN